MTTSEVRIKLGNGRHLWWGEPGGPGQLSALALGGTIDTRFPLAEPPAWCG
jgi:hypothetical protein